MYGTYVYYHTYKGKKKKQVTTKIKCLKKKKEKKIITKKIHIFQ